MKPGRKRKWTNDSKIRTYRCNDDMYDDVQYICDTYGYTINGLIISRFRDLQEKYEKLLEERYKK